jgi:hypothetical protein
MGIEMNLGSSDNQAHSVSDVFSNRIHSYENIQKALYRFINTTNLQGNAYSAARNYTQYVLIPLLQGCVLLDEALKESCSKLPEEYRSRVDTISLSEDELNRQIMNANNMVIDYERLIDQENTKTTPNSQNINSFRMNKDNYERLKQTLERKLAKLIEFNSYSVQIFSHIDFLMDNIHQGLQHTKNVWDSNNRMISASEITLMPWASKLSTEWARRKILTNAMDFFMNPDFIENKIADIHPWFKTAFTMTKNFGNAVSKKYTRSTFYAFGEKGVKANENLKTAWRTMKKYANSQNWNWYNNLGSKWKRGSFNDVLNTIQHSVIDKIANLKFGNVSINKISEVIGKVTEPIKAGIEKIGTMIKESQLFGKLKFLGKWAKIAGWVSMGVDASVTTITEYNNQNSRAYKSEGKSLLHASVSQLKSAGPIEGAIFGSMIGGPVGAILGFAAGSFNTLWGIKNAQEQEEKFSDFQNLLDNTYDVISNSVVGKSIYEFKENIKQTVGNAVSGALDSIVGMFKGGVENAQ